MRKTRAMLRALAYRMLSGMAAREITVRQEVAEVIYGTDCVVKITIKPNGNGVPRNNGELHQLSRAEKKIMDAVDGVPMSIKALSRKAGYNYTYSLPIVANLIRRDLLKKTPEGVCRP